MKQDLVEVPFALGVALVKTTIMSNAVKSGKTLAEAKTLSESVTSEDVQKALIKIARKHR